MYKVIEIEKSFIDSIDTIIKNVYISSSLNSEDCWIAGGFARLIANCYLNNIKNPEKLIIKYCASNWTDIDFFSAKSLKEPESFQKVLNCSVVNSSYEGMFSNKFLIKPNIKDSVYEEIIPSKYALNISVPIRNIFKEPGTVEDAFGESFIDDRCKIQFINTFQYNNFEECLDSFDLFNSKYLLYKEKDKYFLMYHKKAVESDNEGVIRIDNLHSPFLLSRVLKYNHVKGLKVIDDEQNNNILKEYIIKYISSFWEESFDIYGGKQFFNTRFKALHKIYKLDNLKLSLLINQFTDFITIKNDDLKYGWHESVKVDWATNAIINNK